MAQRRVLYISNNHPDLCIGGTEVFAYDLYQGMKSSGAFEPVLLARTINPGHRSPEETPFRALNGDPNQVLWFMEHYDHLFMSSTHKEQYTVHFGHFLQSFRPDVVHIQHTMGLGVSLIRQIRNSLPAVPIVYTLQEFQPICHANGLLLRVAGGERCLEASPTRCHECFPDIVPQQFFLRERFLKAHFELVDLFLAPSRHLIERFVDWGIPRSKMRFQEYARVLPPRPELPAADQHPAVGNFAFMGQLRPHKGILVLLEAMQQLEQEGERDLHLFVNGVYLEFEEESFQKQVESLLGSCSNVTFLGPYPPSEIADRMRDISWVVVPSTWWENSPLVIQEAFFHRRPVICSDIGGMVEKVDDNVNGFTFRAGDAADLAAVLRRAGRSREHWLRLQDGIPPIYSMPQAIDDHCAIYRDLIATRAG